MVRVRVQPAMLRDASYVMANLRPADEAEVMCQVPDGTKKHEIAWALLIAGDAFVASIDDQPVAVFGTSGLNVACCSAWALGTRRTKRVVPAMTRFLREVHGPDLIGRGFRTMEARSHVEHLEAHRWMAATGAVRVDPPFEYGKNGELFVIYRWTPAALTLNAREKDNRLVLQNA